MNPQKPFSPAYLTRLRTETQPEHTALETLTGGDRMMSGQMSKERYGRLLHTHLQFHWLVADTLSDLGIEVLDWPKCSRIEALSSDLNQLGTSAHPIAFPHLSTTPTLAYAMGLAYVSEGSCLGNVQLSKALKKSSDFRDWKANQFFDSCAADTSQRWKSFLELLHPHGERDADALIQGGRDGYAAFRWYWLNS